MIEYTPQNQLGLELFKHLFEREPDRENRWGKLAAIIQWDDLAADTPKISKANQAARV